jgi:pyruvate,water dikinase
MNMDIFSDPEILAASEAIRSIANAIDSKNAIWWGTQKALDQGNVGGKNAKLAHLFQAGLPVPEGFAIPSFVFENRVNKRALFEAIDDGDYKKAREIAESTPVPNDILKMYDLRLPGQRVAVRSSAIAEDSSNASFAGQLDSYNYQTRDGGHDVEPNPPDAFRDRGLARAIQEVWGSYFSDRAMKYKTDKHDIRVAVVVQKQVDPEFSGVAFSANPMAGRLDEHVVNAGPGHGENVVAGLVTPDQFITDKETGTPKSLNGEYMLLEPHHLRQVHQMAQAAEDYFGYPQDVEWAKDKNGDQIYFLQSRDITKGLPRDTPRYPGLQQEKTMQPTRFENA